jgi:hypothetical protein
MSALDRIISPEIRNDRFSRAIADIAATAGVREILEIGSSSGEGSTEAWIAGALANPERPRIHCIEVSVARYRALAERVKDLPFVRPYNVSSVELSRFPTSDEVERFYRDVRSKLRRTPLETVLAWLEQDVAYVDGHGLSSNGIRDIMHSNEIAAFDAVLIDGSEFTGTPELEDVYGARFLLLDDTRTFKNWENCRRLESDPLYRRTHSGRWTRNGFAVFERV